MDEPGELHPRHMPTGGLLAGEIPDRLVGGGEPIGEETTAVVLGEDPGVTPPLPGHGTALLWHRPDVEDVDDQQVTGLGALDRERPRKLVHHGQVAVADIVGIVGVDDGAVEPFLGLHTEAVAGLHRGHGWDIGMPPVVADQLLLPERLALVDGKDHIRHGRTPRIVVDAVVFTARAASGAVGPRIGGPMFLPRLTFVGPPRVRSGTVHAGRGCACQPGQM